MEGLSRLVALVGDNGCAVAVERGEYRCFGVPEAFALGTNEPW